MALILASSFEPRGGAVSGVRVCAFVGRASGFGFKSSVPLGAGAGAGIAGPGGAGADCEGF